MGGTLAVESRPGAGSVFTLKLELALCADTVHERAERRPRIAAATDGPPRRVLVAEDNVVNQKIAIHLLEKFGCRVDVAANGREAVEMAMSFPYDLIFMDCRMPEMDGFTATREIRAQQANGHRTPIVAMTAHAIKGASEECLDAGMDAYIAKPVKPAEIEHALALWTRRPA
jgi:CheY-like chemotaxis protein